jgi:hypothetical protein
MAQYIKTKPKTAGTEKNPAAYVPANIPEPTWPVLCPARSATLLKMGKTSAFFPDELVLIQAFF